MKCPNCQHDNPEDSKFCLECGQKVELKCSECGKTLPIGAKFCNECGHDLRKPKALTPVDYSQPQSYTPKFLADKILNTRGSIEGERKLVTIFFADVANYTSMSEKLDPEEVHQIMDDCFKIIMDEIHKYEGTINQFTGDGVMALFGAPVAHEDHAQRACHAALSIQKAMGECGEKIKQDIGVDFRMRIGLNSGPVIVGSIGNDLRMDYTAVGDTTNLAARMESEAKPGCILVSTNTHRIARDYFEFRSMGKIDVKGKEEPQDVYELLKPSEAETRLDVSVSKGLTRFVGRKKSIPGLMEVYAKAMSGSGQIVGVVGEAGVGKSRLLLEFKNRTSHDQYTYLEGRCLHYGGSMAYLPLLDILRSYFDIKEEDREYVINKKIKEKASKLGMKLPDAVSPFQELLSLKVEDDQYKKLDPQMKRVVTFEALRDLLIKESQQGALVLAVEDLHWIDKTSEDFLDYLTGWLANTQILLILLYRPEYTHQWGSKSYYNRIGLDQLGPASSAELISAILENGAVAPELREVILNRATGNPLFMEEFAHTLMENGSIRKKGDQYVLTRKASEIEVPDTIQGIIAARMDRLEENLKQTMQVASVIGRDFAFRILDAITGTKEELKSYLLNLQGLELIYEKRLFPELEYIFKHALIQEVAYNSLLNRRRKEIHEKIGNAIETAYPERLEEQYEALAHHFHHSANAEKALHYLKLAARKAARRYSFPEARHQYAEAVAILDSMEATPERQRQRADLVLRWASVAAAGRSPEIPGALERSLVDAREWGDLALAVRLSRHLGSFQIGLGNLNGFAALDECLSTAEKLGDEARVALVMDSTGRSMFHAGRNRESTDWLGRSIPLLERMGNMMEVSFSSCYQAIAHAECGEFKEAERSVRKGRKVAETLNHPGCILFAHYCRGRMEINRGNWEQGEAELVRAIEPARHFEYPVQYAEDMALLGLAAYRQGHTKKGPAQIVEGIGFLEPVGSKTWMPFLPMWYGRLAQLNAEQGRWTEAEAFLEKCMELDYEWNLGRVNCEMAQALMAAHQAPYDWQAAEAHAEKALKLAEKLELRPDLALGHLDCAKLLAEKGDAERAKEHLQFATNLFTEMEMTWWLEQAKEIGKRLSPT